VNSAELCRKKGWKAGTVLDGRIGGKTHRIRITAVGEESVLVRIIGVKHNSDEDFYMQEETEQNWDLSCRDWTEVSHVLQGPSFRRWRDLPTAKEKPPYWEQLQDIIEVAAQLQASPIPDDEILQQINLMRLGYAEYELAQIQLTLPFVRHLPPAPIVKWPLSASSVAETSRDFYVTGDPDAPGGIKDKNGFVVLLQCRKCGQAENEITPKCPGKPPEDTCPADKTP